MTVNDWPMLTLAVTVALAVAAAALAYLRWREPRPTLPLPHVAGAALVGLFGWEVVVNLPGAVLGYFTLTAGLGEVSGVEIDQAFVIAQIVFAVAAAFAVVGVLRRRVWGVALGIGLSFALLATTLAGAVQTVALYGDAQIIGDINYLGAVATTIALRAVPPSVAIGLFVWPLLEARFAPRMRRSHHMSSPTGTAARRRLTRLTEVVCGRFSQGEPSRHISDYFGAYPDDDLPAGLYNVPPTETIRMVVRREDERLLVAARWGFRPFWGVIDGNRKAASSWINARAETAWDSPAFGRALRTRRCVIPADAFYEWDRSTSPRQPYAIGPAVGSGEMLALAGIWAPVHGEGLTAAILTTTPNELLATIHDRMPVILDRDDLDVWLDRYADLGHVQSMLTPAPVETLRMWPVSTAINKVDVDGPHLLRPIEPASSLGLA